MLEKVIFTDDIRTALHQALDHQKFSGIAVLVDNHTSRDCYPIIEGVTDHPLIIRVTPGEKHKNITTCEWIWDALTQAKFDRKSLLINLGGGVISDMGGFCASTYKRGIKFINLPTTLLAQVDASVGGKLGIDFHGFKNQIGLFVMPELVIIDTGFLKTLPLRELKSGFAEAIKHCLIYDREEWYKLNQNSLDQQPWKNLVNRSVKIKSSIVEQDPLEKGLRKILNFGHTIGHALESFFLETAGNIVLHGEAIAAGMICEIFLSEELTGLDKKESFQALEFIFNTYGKLSFDKKDIPRIAELTQQDKKNESGELRFSLINRIGQASYNIPVTAEQVANVLDRYCHI